MMNTFDGEKIVLTVNCNTLVENFLILDFFSSTYMYKPVKKQETLKFFNKSRKVSIDLIISEHTKKKTLPEKKYPYSKAMEFCMRRKNQNKTNSCGIASMELL